MSKQKSTYFFVFLIFFLVKLSECDKNKSEDRSLYENSTAITAAIPANLKYLIYDKPWSSLVFFYQNWCEKCLEQVDINLELEKELVYWQAVVKLVVINYDAQVGRDFNVSNSFEYRLAKPFTRSTHLIKFEPNNLNSKESIIRSTLAALFKLNKTNQDFKAINWPKLNPLNELKETSLFSNKSLLFVNKDSSIEESLISFETILDFSNYTDLDILNCNESTFENSNHSKQHIKYPALYQFIEQNQTFNLIGQGLSRNEFRNLTISKFLSTKWNSIELETKSKIKNVTLEEEASTNLIPVHYRDLNNALRKVFFSDFCRFKVLSPERVQIMTNLSIVFREYFPTDNENTKRFLRRVSQWLKEQNQTEPLKVDKIKATIKAGAEGFLQTEQPYISCKGSQPYLKGYPCSIWLLFHTLTVQEYLKFTNKNQTIKKSNFTLPPNQVLPMMKGFILNFFPCTNCRQTFEQDTANLANELVHLNSSILWLWQEHNRFNLLLRNKLNDDPQSPKQIYPLANETVGCKTCYLKETETIENVDDLNRLEWNKTELLNFLINQYRKESLVKSSAAILSNNLIKLIINSLFIYLINRLI